MKQEKLYINTKNGKIKILLLRPKNQTKPLPGILWIHGGGFATGMASMVNFTRGKSIAEKYGAVVISPEYRRSIKHPYPAAFDDCCETLEYMYKNAEALGIDKNKIVVGGESAGGGLAISVCLYARDKTNIKIMLQIPLYPMIDCNDTESSKNNHGHVWNTKRNKSAWKLYLKDLYNTENIPKYASPSREKDYTNLPPCYTFIADGEPFYSETLKYVEDLKKAKVKAKVDIYHGNTHAFDMMLFWTKNAKKAKEKLLQEVEEYFK